MATLMACWGGWQQLGDLSVNTHSGFLCLNVAIMWCGKKIIYQQANHLFTNFLFAGTSVKIGTVAASSQLSWRLLDGLIERLFTEWVRMMMMMMILMTIMAGTWSCWTPSPTSASPRSLSRSTQLGRSLGNDIFEGALQYVHEKIWNVSQLKWSRHPPPFSNRDSVTNLMCEIAHMWLKLLHAFMNWLFMLCKIALSCCFIITQIARILDTFMNWLFMLCKTALLCSFIITQITGIFYTLMNWLYMSTKTWLLSKCGITLLTYECDTSMSTIYM